MFLTLMSDSIVNHCNMIIQVKIVHSLLSLPKRIIFFLFTERADKKKWIKFLGIILSFEGDFQ